MIKEKTSIVVINALQKTKNTQNLNLSLLINVFDVVQTHLIKNSVVIVAKNYLRGTKKYKTGPLVVNL